MAQAPEDAQTADHKIPSDETKYHIDDATDQFLNRYMSNQDAILDPECEKNLRLVPLPPSNMEYNARSILHSFKLHAQNNVKYRLMKFDMNNNIKSIFNPNPKPETYVVHV